MLVEERDVVATIRAGARTVDEVGERCDAGTGCGSCRGGIELLIQEEVRRRGRSRGGAPRAIRADHLLRTIRIVNQVMR